MRWCALLPRPPEPAAEGDHDAITEVHFHEQNGGSGGLTQAVDLRGVKTAKPNDVYTGGTDIRKPADVEALWDAWVQARQRGVCLIIRWAPPCGSMSRARQRSFLTRVRSSSRPCGLRRLTAKQRTTVKHGNDLALITEDLARKAHFHLGLNVLGPRCPGDRFFLKCFCIFHV